MIRSASLFVLALAAFVLAGCGSSPTSPSTITQTELRLGTGTEAAAGNTITVHYTGWLYDPSKPDFKGLQFATSRGSDPFTFTLGAGQVIQGWDQGVVGMKIGGIRRLLIPPSLAYGTIRYHSIPPNANLVFEIELIDVK